MNDGGTNQMETTMASKHYLISKTFGPTLMVIEAGSAAEALDKAESQAIALGVTDNISAMRCAPATFEVEASLLQEMRRAVANRPLCMPTDGSLVEGTVRFEYVQGGVWRCYSGDVPLYEADDADAYVFWCESIGEAVSTEAEEGESRDLPAAKAHYLIANTTSGFVLGVYEGETAGDAIRLMLTEGGCEPDDDAADDIIATRCPAPRFATTMGELADLYSDDRPEGVPHGAVVTMRYDGDGYWQAYRDGQRMDGWGVTMRGARALALIAD